MPAATGPVWHHLGQVPDQSTRRRGVATMDQTTSTGAPSRPAGRPLPPPAAAPAITPRYGWQAARYAVWTLPVYALARMWLALLARPDPAADPAGWVARVTGDGYQRGQLLAGVGGELLALVALVAIAALVPGRGRRFAAAGALCGMAAVVLALPRLSVDAFVAPQLGRAAQDGAAAAVHWYQAASERTDLAASVGAGLLGLALVLLGVAAWRSGVLGRAEGLLLMVAGPALVAAHWYLPVLAPLGALPLLAAGVSIAWSAGRAASG